ncbi:MAG: hypothetical protein U9R57_04640 [Thermodesulfobacteriota bacterium]|nr:hypothetical protein [Thermodesulfobacteriota bacterium]
MDEALRYYANIIGGFSMFVTKAIDRLKDLDIKMIAPSHGIIWRENPQNIIDTYARFAGYRNGPAEPEVTIIWSSMYSNTERVVNAMVQGVRSEGLPVHVHRIPNEDIGFILASAWKCAGLIVGMPTYEYKMFPPMAWHWICLPEKKSGTKKCCGFGPLAGLVVHNVNLSC